MAPGEKEDDFHGDSTVPTEEYSKSSQPIHMMQSADLQKRDAYFGVSNNGDGSKGSGGSKGKGKMKMSGVNQTQKPLADVNSGESSEEERSYASKGKGPRVRVQKRQQSP